MRKASLVTIFLFNKTKLLPPLIHETIIKAIIISKKGMTKKLCLVRSWFKQKYLHRLIQKDNMFKHPQNY